MWYQMNLVPDLHDTHITNRRQKNGIDLWHQFLQCVSCALVGQYDRHPAYNQSTRYLTTWDFKLSRICGHHLNKYNCIMDISNWWRCSCMAVAVVYVGNINQKNVHRELILSF